MSDTDMTDETLFLLVFRGKPGDSEPILYSDDVEVLKSLISIMADRDDLAGILHDEGV